MFKFVHAAGEPEVSPIMVLFLMAIRLHVYGELSHALNLWVVWVLKFVFLRRISENNMFGLKMVIKKGVQILRLAWKQAHPSLAIF